MALANNLVEKGRVPLSLFSSSNGRHKSPFLAWLGLKASLGSSSSEAAVVRPIKTGQFSLRAAVLLLGKILLLSLTQMNVEQ